MEILFAAERLLPAEGGAERFAVEALEALSRRHRARALWLGEPFEPPRGVEGRAAAPLPGGPYWRAKEIGADAIERAVAAELSRRRADVVLTQLHAAPGAVRAAAAAGVPSVVVVPSYESLCPYAFDAGSRCVPGRCGEACPDVRKLDPAERDAFRRTREAHRAALALSAALVAPSEFVAAACERWSGRRAAVVPPASRPAVVPEPASADGHVLFAAVAWSLAKGVELIRPVAARLGDRHVVVTEPGLPERIRRRLARRSNVTLSPARPIEELLAGASLVLVPSQWPEPFGRIALEAQSAGVPCLAGSLGGLAEVVPGQELVTPASDPRAWAEAASRLRDPRAWAEAQSRGREHAGEILAREPLRLLEEVLLGAAL